MWESREATAVLARIGAAVSVARTVARVAKEEEITFLAASVAYYAFLSLLPTAVLALVVASVVGGETLAATVLAASGEFLTPSGQEVLIEALESDQGRGGATLLGLVVLLWGVLKVFRALDIAFSKVYGVDVVPTLVDQVIDSLVVAVSVGFSFALMFAVGALVAAADIEVVLQVASVLFLPLVLTVAFLPIYYRFPDTPVSLREAVPGAVFAALGWTALQAGFQLYAAGASHNAYGLVGGVLLLVTWLYVAGAVVILGAVVNVVLAGRTTPAQDLDEADRQLQQAPGRGSAEMADRDREPRGAPDVTELSDRVAELRADLDAFEEDVERRTVDRPDLESELKAYVRSRMRGGHARGWGPYLVLLYGVVLALGAFYFLDGWPAVAALVVTFTSTLGLYVLFVLFGAGLDLLGSAGKAVDFVRRRR